MATKDAPDYPWYQVVAGSDFTQGDILPDCPLLTPNADEVLLRVTEKSE